MPLPPAIASTREIEGVVLFLRPEIRHVRRRRTMNAVMIDMARGKPPVLDAVVEERSWIVLAGPHRLSACEITLEDNGTYLARLWAEHRWGGAPLRDRDFDCLLAQVGAVLAKNPALRKGGPEAAEA